MMITKEENPVEWAGMMYELEDAHEHLAALISNMESDPTFDKTDFRIQLGHVFAHLNRAWYRRDLLQDIPEGDSDFSLRWHLIKSGFSRALPKTESLSASRKAHGERGIWQRHYWEHLIRDELDYQRHVDYVHVNPLKHGLVTRVQDWPYSTFHRAVERGIYPLNWCGDVDIKLAGDD